MLTKPSPGTVKLREDSLTAVFTLYSGSTSHVDAAGDVGGAPGEGVDRGHVLPRGEHRQQRRGRGRGGGHGEGLHTRHLVLAWNMDCSVFSK